MLELWGMWSTSSLLSLPGSLSSGVIDSDKILSMGQIEVVDIQTECKKLLILNLFFWK